MRYIGTGTQDSPIALDDSEDEVLQELYRPSLSPTQQFPSHQGDIHVSAQTLNNHIEQRPALPGKKRKREHSFSGQDPATNHRAPPPRTHASLVTRLSQPEGKKARKRRRKLERQAAEEARLRNINWLNNAHQFGAVLPSAYPAASGSGWSPELHAHQYPEPSYLPYSSASSSSSMIVNDVAPRAYPMFQDDQELMDNHDSSSVYYLHSEKPSLTSNWVSSMAMVAESSARVNDTREQSSRWSPLSPKIMLPPIQPLPPPVGNSSRPSNASGSKYVEHHALPAKPPPPQPIPSIGVKPDPDPKSKHGIFQIAESMKDVGSDVKNKTSEYTPNPARTLVMEQLPKTHRNADFINKWSRSACGSLPVHMFIDGQVGKALIEFATAELARKAWASPKLGGQYSGLKPHQLKGKPREDLIKVWWYRVAGVGANSGVGEIEEGEIEGDYGDKETEALSVPPKETKKERKARLAKERAIKNKTRDLENKTMKERAAQEQPVITTYQPQALNSENPPIVPSKPAFPVPISPSSSITIPRQVPSASHALLPQPQTGQRYLLPLPTHPSSWGAQQYQAPVNPPLNKTAYGSSIYRRDSSTYDDEESIASSAGRSPSPPPRQVSNQQSNNTTAQTAQQGHEYDYEEADMDVDLDDEHIVPPVTLPRPHPPVHAPLPPPLTPIHILPPPPPPVVAPPPMPPSVSLRPPLHSSLPPRPTPLGPSFGNQKNVLKPLPQSSVLAPSFVPKNQPYTSQHQTKPQAPSNAPQVKPLNNSAIQTPPVVQPKQQSGATSLQTSVSNTPSLNLTSMTTARPNTPVPSEPKAMKNAPTEPSYTKRSLLARQKELEERIAKTKTELANGTLTTKETVPAVILPPPPAPDTEAKPVMDNGEKQAMEDRLRKLVLQSRNSSKGTPKVDDPKVQPAAIPTPTVAASAVPKEETTSLSPPSFSASSNTISLEDMAVSFITQTIDTIKSQPMSLPPPPKYTPQLQQSQSSAKLQLAAKQKRLEQHIAESKALMEKFAKCTTKTEKDKMLRIMREHTRQYEEDVKATTLLPTPSSSNSSVSTHNVNSAFNSVTQKTQSATSTQQVCLPRWPASQVDAGVLILSDDDDDFEEDDD